MAAGSGVPSFKSFVSEKEVEEVRKKRQEEWEKVRKPSDPIERPEPEIDNRTLYDRLKAQKDQKQEEWSEQFKFKNMIYKGLDEDESGFLTLVAQKRAEHEADVIRNEISEVVAYREAVSRLHDDAESLPTSSARETDDKDKSDPTKSLGARKSKPKSQLSLLAGSIKTKRKRSSSEASDSNESTSVGGQAQTTHDKKVKIDQESSGRVVTTPSQSTQLPGALPGLAEYSSSESDDD